MIPIYKLFKSQQEVSLDEVERSSSEESQEHQDIIQGLGNMSLNPTSQTYSVSNDINRFFTPDKAVWHIPRYHDDDIHSLNIWGSYCITGSKDTSVKLLNLTDMYQEIICSYKIYDGINIKFSYEKWVTAMDIANDGFIIAGYRDGNFFSKSLEDHTSSSVKNISDMLMTDEDGRLAFHKIRNNFRITALKFFNQVNPFFLFGTPGNVFYFDLRRKNFMHSLALNTKEWVYGFLAISQDKTLAIQGCNVIELSVSDTEMRQNTNPLIREHPKIGAQRQFASSIYKFPEQNSLISLSFFGGKNRVYDIEANDMKRPVHYGDEHNGRVWHSLPNTPNTYLTCADDGCVKLWDIRKSKSVITISGHDGRVSCIDTISDTEFITGSCADDNRQLGSNKGVISLYDLKML